MKRLTQTQSELIDAFLAEHGARVSTAQLEKDFLISEVFSAFTAPVVYREHEAKFVLCGGTAVSKAHRFTERISEDVDLRVIVPTGLSRSAQKRLLSHVKAEVLDRLRQQGYDIPDEIVKAGNENRYIAILLSYESLYPPDQALRPELLIEISALPDPDSCGVWLRYHRQRTARARRAQRLDRMSRHPRDHRRQERSPAAAMVGASTRRRPGVRTGQRPR